MSWTRLTDTFHGSPKVKRLARALGISPVLARGHLTTLWSWCMVHAPSGDVSRYDDDDLEAACEWDGDSGAFVAAALAERFIEEDTDGRRIHDWLAYAEGHVRAERERDRRSRTRGPCVTHASVTHEALAAVATDTRVGEIRSDQKDQKEEIRSDQTRAGAREPDGFTPPIPEEARRAARVSLSESLEARARDAQLRQRGEMKIRPSGVEMRHRLTHHYAYRRQLLLPLALSKEHDPQLRLPLFSLMREDGSNACW